MSSLFSVLRSRLAATAGIAAALAAVAYAVDEYKSGIVWPEPKVVTPGDATHAPSDAIVLFNGKDMSAFDGGKWQVADGVATVNGGQVTTKQKFGDCQLHVEFATPAEVKGNGQGRGNSGLYFMGHYELQVLDSFENPTYFDGQCASIYKQHPPLVNACRKPGEWQSYDVIFTRPRFNEDGSVKTPAYFTVLHNGVLVQNHFACTGYTFYDKPPAYSKHDDKGAISIQDHGNPVKYRNIWIRELE